VGCVAVKNYLLIDISMGKYVLSIFWLIEKYNYLDLIYIINFNLFERVQTLLAEYTNISTRKSF